MNSFTINPFSKNKQHNKQHDYKHNGYMKQILFYNTKQYNTIETT